MWEVISMSVFFQPCEAVRQVRLRLAACGLSQGEETASQLPGDECDTSSSRHVSACGSHFLFRVVILLFYFQRLIKICFRSVLNRNLLHLWIRSKKEMISPSLITMNVSS